MSLPQESETAISFRSVRFTYDNQTDVLKGIDLDIPAGQFVCILGANGCGKSTLVKHINALLLPDSGTVSIFGMDTRDKGNVLNIRKTAGMVFQNPDNQLVASIVEHDVAFGPENLGLPSDEIARRVDAALAAVGLTELREREVYTLSGGEKQRVAIAGVIAMEPRIIVFDEAASMLDPQGRMEHLGIICDLHAKGMTIVMVTHDTNVATLADRVIVMEAGSIIADGTPNDILHDEPLLRNAKLYYDLAEIAAGTQRAAVRG